jgi:hypothetical protein
MVEERLAHACSHRSENQDGSVELITIINFMSWEQTQGSEVQTQLHDYQCDEVWFRNKDCLALHLANDHEVDKLWQEMSTFCDVNLPEAVMAGIDG